MNLFVYGILTHPANVHFITGMEFASHPGFIRGFSKNPGPPAYVTKVDDMDEIVVGRILFDIDLVSLALLDGVEKNGFMYNREWVSAHDLTTNTAVECDVYVGKWIACNKS